MKQFALTGAAGYIASRHMKAIKETGNELICALDKNDSVGIIDSFFPMADFFVEFERFDRHIDKLRNTDQHVDFVSICTPNYLHDSHIRFALRSDSDAICEKPIVLNPWNIDALEEYQNRIGKKVYNILQLRLHESIIGLKNRILKEASNMKYELDLNYITSRGNWYFTSWKADLIKSGGVATNIGVHFFDMLSWLFGPILENVVHIHQADKAAGYLEFKMARVRWFLSIDHNDIPILERRKGKRTYRSLRLGDEEIEFSSGFTNLHTKSYEQILSGKGFELHEARNSIEIVHKIRNSGSVGLKGDYHPYLKEIDLENQTRRQHFRY
jgi:UDP-N-acetyl-2-amino-2-deoxyglucuronate dehydrogenase